MNLSQFCHESIVTIQQDQTLVEAAQVMRSKNVGSLIVMDEGPHRSCAVGIITDRDLVTKAMACAFDLTVTKVQAICSEALITIERSLSIETAIETMLRHNVRRLLIVDTESRAVGIMSATDAIRSLSADILNSGHQLTKISDLFLIQSGTAASHRAHDFTRMA